MEPGDDPPVDPPQPDLCVQYAEHAPLCVSALIARLEAHRLV